MTLPAKLFLGAVIVFVAHSMFSATNRQTSNDAPRSSPPPPKQEDEATRIAKDRERNRLYTAGLQAKAIQDSARDPDSLVFERILANEDATIVCIAYRARNGFGGMNREAIVFIKDRPSTNAATFTKNCPLATFDLTHISTVVRAFR